MDIDSDSCSHLKNQIFFRTREYLRNLNEKNDLIRIITFKKETTKSAIKTACRGLGINSDVAGLLSSLVPVERGKVWDFKDCYYGNEEKHRKPIAELVKLVDEYENINLKDTIIKINGLVTGVGSHACFTGEAMIRTSKGAKPIKTIQKGDMVLTHKNRYRKVIETIKTHSKNNLYELKVRGAFNSKVTGNHPMYVISRDLPRYKKIFSKPYWKEVQELKPLEDYIGYPINNVEIIPNREDYKHLPLDNKNFWWVIGRYIGDGWTEGVKRNRYGKGDWIEKRIIICCDAHDIKEKEEIENRLKLIPNLFYRFEDRGTSTYKFFLKMDKLWDYLQEFGKYAHGKFLNKDCINLPKDLAKSFIEGYLSADGHYYADKNRYSLKTVSKQLALDFMNLLGKCYNRYCTIVTIPPKQEIIEGRIINSKEKYELKFTKDNRISDKNFYKDGYIWKQVREISLLEENATTYNFQVEEDESYVVNGMIAHNCGVIPINKSINYFSSAMRTPSGELICSYDLHQIEQNGAIKYDFLLTSAMSLIQICMLKLCEDGLMEWQGSLKKTYQKYLSPSVIDLNDEEVWNNIRNAKVMNLFQFETIVGSDCIKKLQPHNLTDLGNANALMRLMVDEEGAEQPLDKYIRFKNNISEWDKEMEQFGLSEKDKRICHKLLDSDYGVSSTQESMMMMFMDKETTNFGVKEVNVLKKGVGKKKPELIEKFTQMAYERMKEKQLSKPLIDYLLNVQTSYQKGYSFSKPHVIAYSLIAYIEAWLYTKYPKIYWYYANLTVKTNTIEEDEEDIELDFETAKKTIDYGKVAKAIDDIMRQGVKITTPNINESDNSFKPLPKENTILYGLEGINSVNEEMVQLIKENRPYNSFMDFYNRVAIQKKETINEETGKITKKAIVSNKAIEMLIKSGCFDGLEKDKTRDEILLQFCSILAKTKNKLTATDITFMEDNNIIPLELRDELRIYNFSSYLKKVMPSYKHETSKNMKWIRIKEDNEEDTEYDKQFFYEFFADNMEEGKDYFTDNEGIINVLIGTKRKGSFESIVAERIAKLTDYMKTKEAINEVNTIKINEFKKPIFEGGFNKWEMQSLSFYSKEHELENVNRDKYDIVNFFDLPEESEIDSYGHFIVRKGEEAGKEVIYPIWKLSIIAGTVLSKNNTKHMVTLLTRDGVVNVKFQEGQYAFYNKKISKIVFNEKNGKEEKKTIENSWFSRGEKLIVVGYRRSDTFVAKRYAKTRYQHTVQLIKDIKDNGDLVLKQDRTRI